jgi:hypothetical protein
LRSPFAVRRSPFTVHRSPFTVHRSPFTVHRSPFTVHRSPFAVRRSAFRGAGRTEWQVKVAPSGTNSHERLLPFRPPDARSLSALKITIRILLHVELLSITSEIGVVDAFSGENVIELVGSAPAFREEASIREARQDE